MCLNLLQNNNFFLFLQRGGKLENINGHRLQDTFYVKNRLVMIRMHHTLIESELLLELNE